MQQLLFFVDGIADRELFLVSNRPLNGGERTMRVHEFVNSKRQKFLSPSLYRIA